MLRTTALKGSEHLPLGGCEAGGRGEKERTGGARKIHKKTNKYTVNKYINN